MNKNILPSLSKKTLQLYILASFIGIIACILISGFHFSFVPKLVFAQIPTNPWIGLFKLGASNTDYIWKKDIDCPLTPNGAPSNGGCDYALTSPTEPGTYEFRFFVNGKLVQKSQPITVIPVIPNATIDGPKVILPGGSGIFTATAQGERIDKISIQRIYKSDFIQYDSRWKTLGEKDCGGTASCSLQASWTPSASETGPWYIIVKALDQNKSQCSGNPKADSDKAWHSPENTIWYDCGLQDSLIVEVQSPAKQGITEAPKPGSYGCEPDPQCAKGNNNLQLCRLICTPK